MIPLKCESERSGVPIATLLTVVICVTVHLGSTSLRETGSMFTPAGLMRTLVNPQSGWEQILPALVLSIFTHASLMHLVTNMWFLLLFGTAFEQTTGSITFAVTYLLCGVTSMLVQAFSTPYSGIPIVGASGAIAGIMGALLVLRPLCRTVVWIPLFFFIRIPAFLFFAIWIAMQYLGLRREILPGSAGVAWWAHIGGFFTGFVLAIEIRRRLWLTVRKRTRRHTKEH